MLIILTEEEYDKLSKLKGNKTWKEFFISSHLISDKEKIINEVNNFFYILQTKLTNENKEVLELVRVLLVNYINKDYENVAKILDKLANILNTKANMPESQ